MDLLLAEVIFRICAKANETPLADGFTDNVQDKKVRFLVRFPWCK